MDRWEYVLRALNEQMSLGTFLDPNHMGGSEESCRAFNDSRAALKDAMEKIGIGGDFNE